jgi:hypothetical protein
MATNKKTPNSSVYIGRVLDLGSLLQKKSHFLFGLQKKLKRYQDIELS